MITYVIGGWDDSWSMVNWLEKESNAKWSGNPGEAHSYKGPVHKGQNEPVWLEIKWDSEDNIENDEDRISDFHKYSEKVNFPTLSIEEQFNAIPKEFYEKIELPYELITRSKPGVTLTKHPDNHSGSCRCDKIKGLSKCLSGMTEFY